MALSRRVTSAPDTDSASLFLLIFCFFFVATLCVNKDLYIAHTLMDGNIFGCFILVITSIQHPFINV